MLDILKELKHAPLTRHINYMQIPTSILGVDDLAMEHFNLIYDYLKTYPDIHEVSFTHSGGISVSRENLRLPAYGIKRTQTCVEIVILIVEGMWRIQFRNELPQDEKKNKISGKKAFLRFKDLCEEEGIFLDMYKTTNGWNIKKEIEKPLIQLKRESSKDRIYENVHHIDFHSSYPAGLCNTHPEFRPVVEPIYEGRHDHPIFKSILNFSIGFMQSWGGCKARWAHLAKDAIADNNKRVRDISDRLENSGRVILSYNTDGVWYTGEIYHGEGEGEGLGQWSNDHVNCTWRAKSAGAYEFIENGKYTAVLRGQSSYDKVKPREEWQWGDIYRAEASVIKYKFDEEEGITRYEE